MLETLKRTMGLAPGWARILAIAPVALLVAGCNQVGSQNVTFWDIIWSISIFFLWLIFIWMFVALFVDVIRRRDLSGWGKAGWIIFMLILPFIGILAYIAFRPANIGYLGMGASPDYGVSAAPAGQGTMTDELTRLNALRESGAITDAEYQTLKAKAIA